MPKPTAHIFRKELREMMRDKRVLTSAFVGPIFLIVIMLVLFGFLQETISKPKPQTIHIVRNPATDDALKSLKNMNGLSLVPVSSVAEGERLIREGKAKLVLNAKPRPKSADGREAQETIDAYFNPEEPLAAITMQSVQKGIREANRDRVSQILASAGIAKEMSEPVRLVEKPLPPKEGIGSAMIIGMVPYLIVIWAFYGGFSVVTDLVTGEKEKSTLETLLITPVSRTQIALGKFWALCCLCLTSSLMSLFGLIVVGLLHLPITKGLFPNGVTVSMQMLLSVGVVLLPLVALFASVLLSVSTFARNTREAQTHLTLVSFVVLMPAIFSQFIGFTDFAQARWVNFVPILNTATCIRDALMGKTDGIALLCTVGTSAVLAACGIRWAVWMFNREQVLTRV